MSATSETLRMVDAPSPLHPLGSRAKILLTSVFGPYGRANRLVEAAAGGEAIGNRLDVRAADVL